MMNPLSTAIYFLLSGLVGLGLLKSKIRSLIKLLHSLILVSLLIIPSESVWAINNSINHTCLIHSEEVYCWGDSAPMFYPADVYESLVSPSVISTGMLDMCVIDSPGSEWDWDLSPATSKIVKCMGGNSNIRQANDLSIFNPSLLAIGTNFACAKAEGYNKPGSISDLFGGSPTGETQILLEGSVFCWHPPAARFLSGFMDGIRDFSTSTFFLTAKGNQACLLDDDGVDCWGDVNSRELFPELIQFQTSQPDVNNPTSIAIGGVHTCVLHDDGVSCWGLPFDGQLNSPTNLSNPVNIVAGAGHSCVLDDNGVTCWGNNDYGQTDVPYLRNPTWIYAGQAHTCSLDDSGVKCWGINDMNQLSVPEELIFDQYGVIFGDISGAADQGSATFGTLIATDVDGLTDGSYFSISTPPTYGQALINPSSGVWTYIADSTYAGFDPFTVTVTDDLDGTTEQVVTITAIGPDTDGDGVYDFSDNCQNTANFDQSDNDTDGIGDACDPDIDNDGLLNEIEERFGGSNYDDSDSSVVIANIQTFSETAPADSDLDGVPDDVEAMLGEDNTSSTLQDLLDTLSTIATAKNVPAMGGIGLLALGLSMLGFGAVRLKRKVS